MGRDYRPSARPFLAPIIAVQKTIGSIAVPLFYEDAEYFQEDRRIEDSMDMLDLFFDIYRKSGNLVNGNTPNFSDGDVAVAKLALGSVHQAIELKLAIKSLDVEAALDYLVAANVVFKGMQNDLKQGSIIDFLSEYCLTRGFSFTASKLATCKPCTTLAEFARNNFCMPDNEVEIGIIEAVMGYETGYAAIHEFSALNISKEDWL